MSDTIFFPTQREQAAKLLSGLSLVQYVVSSHRTQGTSAFKSTSWWSLFGNEWWNYCLKHTVMCNETKTRDNNSGSSNLWQPVACFQWASLQLLMPSPADSLSLHQFEWLGGAYLSLWAVFVGSQLENRLIVLLVYRGPSVVREMSGLNLMLLSV